MIHTAPARIPCRQQFCILSEHPATEPHLMANGIDYKDGDTPVPDVTKVRRPRNSRTY